MPMRNLLRELRRREVFRTAGIYIGTCWIAIEVASVVLAAFDAPEWSLRAIIIGVAVGFPITLVLAWIYDVTDRGIAVQDDVPRSPALAVANRKMDFVAIGVLSVALVISLSVNVSGKLAKSAPIEPAPAVPADDLSNATGDALSDGSLAAAHQREILRGGGADGGIVEPYAITVSEAGSLKCRPDHEVLR